MEFFTIFVFLEDVFNKLGMDLTVGFVDLVDCKLFNDELRDRTLVGWIRILLP